jgi:hypothetical protein
MTTEAPVSCESRGLGLSIRTSGFQVAKELSAPFWYTIPLVVRLPRDQRRPEKDRPGLASPTNRLTKRRIEFERLNLSDGGPLFTARQPGRPPALIHDLVVM